MCYFGMNFPRVFFCLGHGRIQCIPGWLWVHVWCRFVQVAIHSLDFLLHLFHTVWSWQCDTIVVAHVVQGVALPVFMLRFVPIDARLLLVELRLLGCMHARRPSCSLALQNLAAAANVRVRE